MKKFFVILTILALALCLSLGAVGCKKDEQTGGEGTYTVYAPDGAPALSVAGIYGTYRSETFNVRVVKADLISTFVTGEDPKADFALVPVNVAVKLLGSGEKYKMLGTVTHGNLFILKKAGGTDIGSVADLAGLKGKTVGIINLANVPGLTFKAILHANDVEFNVLTEGAKPDGSKVNLINVKPTEVLPNSSCDYFVVPEPQASTKIGATQGKLALAGSLQTLYGGEDGYPQAVAVVKTSVIESAPAAVEDFIASFTDTVNWLKSDGTPSEDIVHAVREMTDGDLAPMFNAQNLTKSVINNCNINFVSNKVGKAQVVEFMQKLNAVSNNAWGAPADKFFY